MNSPGTKSAPQDSEGLIPGKNMGSAISADNSRKNRIGRRHPSFRWLCVSDAGIYLVKHEHEPTKDQLIIMETYR